MAGAIEIDRPRLPQGIRNARELALRVIAKGRRVSQRISGRETVPGPLELPQFKFLGKALVLAHRPHPGDILVPFRGVRQTRASSL